MPDNPMTIPANRATHTGLCELGGVDRGFVGKYPVHGTYAIMSAEAARLFVAEFKRENPDIWLSEAHWTKLIDFLSREA